MKHPRNIARTLAVIKQDRGTVMADRPPFQNAVRDLELLFTKAPQKGTRYVIEITTSDLINLNLTDAELNDYYLPKMFPIAETSEFSGRVLARIEAPRKTKEG